MGAHDDNIRPTLKMFLHTDNIFRMEKIECLILLRPERVKDANLISETRLRSLKELKIRLDGVHGDDEMVAVGAGLNVLQTYECLPLLWLTDDRA